MAQNIDKVYMSSGSEYEGYISEQMPGFKIVVSATLATVNMSSDRVSDVKTVNKDVAELDAALQGWMKQNRPNAKSLEVSTLNIDGDKYENVVILGNDGERVRLLIANEDRYVLDWEDIEKTTKTPSESAKFGLKEIVTLQNGKVYEGNIVEQVLGRQLTVKADNGKMNVIKVSDIASIKTVQRDAQASLWSQVQYLDEIKVSGNVEKRGFISARNMGRSIEIIVEGQTTAEKIDIANVISYRKVANSQYGAPEADKSSEVAAAKPATQPEAKPAAPAKTAPAKTAPKSATDAAKNVADAAKGAETKPAQAEPAQPQAAESKPAEPKPILAAPTGFYINGKPVALSKVAIAATKLSFISKTYVIAPTATLIQVSNKQPIIITLPADVEFSDDVYIAKTDKKEVTLGESETKTECYTFTKAKAEKSLVGFFTTKRGDNIELKITAIEPGVYALWPIGENADSCLTFEVK